MLRNKCAKLVFRAQWLVTVGGSWEVVGDGSVVQCKTHFVQIFHIFFFMEHIFGDPPLKLVPRFRSVLRRGRSGYEIMSPFSLTHSLSQLFMNTLCFVTIKAALFLFKTISAIKCCSRWELICFLSRLQLFPKNPALMGKLMWSSKLQSVTLIIFAPAVPPLSIRRYQQRLRLYG